MPTPSLSNEEFNALIVGTTTKVKDLVEKQVTFNETTPLDVLDDVQTEFDDARHSLLTAMALADGNTKKEEDIGDLLPMIDQALVGIFKLKLKK
jgi:tellurite resistance protein